MLGILHISDFNTFMSLMPLTGGGQATFDFLTVVVRDAFDDTFDYDHDGSIEAESEAGLIILETLDEFDNLQVLFTYYVAKVEAGSNGFEPWLISTPSLSPSPSVSVSVSRQRFHPEPVIKSHCPS